ncbi:MAG: hypothetical protein ABI882_16695, partial [Acidobacteriota bacterium]
RPATASARTGGDKPRPYGLREGLLVPQPPLFRPNGALAVKDNLFTLVRDPKGSDLSSSVT